MFLAGYEPGIQSIAQKLRAIVLEISPDAIEQIDLPAKMLAYGFAKTYKDMLCTIMPQKNYVNLGFPRGTELSDPASLLTGTGKRARHVKVSTIEEAENPEIRRLIEDSIKLTKG